MQRNSEYACTELLKDAAIGLYNILPERKQGNRCQKIIAEEAKTSVMKSRYIKKSIEVN